ncbi:MAG: transposase [Firmicutes bacterium]|nr:transposase [Bacillota bacterium]
MKYCVNQRKPNSMVSSLSGKAQKPYNPADMLKLYLYGYFNGIRTSRKLETECKRNIELMWLIQEL